MKKSTLTQVTLNRRVTFDRRIEFFSFFLKKKMKKKQKKRFANGLIEFGNRGFGLSTDALISLNQWKSSYQEHSRSRSPSYSHFVQVPRSIYIFGIDCQTTLQVQEKLI